MVPVKDIKPAEITMDLKLTSMPVKYLNLLEVLRILIDVSWTQCYISYSMHCLYSFCHLPHISYILHCHLKNHLKMYETQPAASYKVSHSNVNNNSFILIYTVACFHVLVDLKPSNI